MTTSIMIDKTYDIPEDEQEIYESWKSYFDEHLEEGKDIFTHMVLFADTYYFSDQDIELNSGERESILGLHEDIQSSITFNKNKYIYLRQIETDDDKLLFYVSVDEKCEKEHTPFIILIKFMGEDLVFVGKCVKSNQARGIKYIKNNYRVDDDSESEDEE